MFVSGALTWTPILIATDADIVAAVVVKSFLPFTNFVGLTISVTLDCTIPVFNFSLIVESIAVFVLILTRFVINGLFVDSRELKMFVSFNLKKTIKI